jgi:acyl carrier protein
MAVGIPIEQGMNSGNNNAVIAEHGTTKQLARVWQDLFGIKSVGLDENFFDLGGDSSLAVRMFAEIEKLFNVKLPR